ncbi:uncharacterized protein LOC116199351 [Punica granatum]|uniref:Uncharacterized protein LOC116188817 n=1 Tax=Punica granatum TaxID=22663 RepID=A0A218XYA2_PUNGR|nr:uncharacterized protein LOC116188817 [Punica granatum]XP_031385534.1 uncharacterized protein LOC116199351 [Punica granatum]OWM89461.1 hypothetical protein CDL15_Pgr024209 [Punica granatum]
MAPKGEGVLEWTEALENAFITILLEKFTRTHTTYWKARDWEQMNKELEEQFPGTILDANKLRQKLRRLRIQYTQFTELIGHTGVGWDETTNTVKANADVWDKFIKKNSSFKTFQNKGCKHYTSLKELFRSKTATGALRISSTDPPKSPETYARMEEEFLAAASSRGKEPINLDEGSGDSDDPVNEVTEPVVTGSRRRVRKRSSTTGSRLQECLDMLKCNLSNRDKDIHCTPPETKKSKSVTSPDKPAKGSIEEAMDVLNKMRPSMSIKEYLVASDRLSREEHTRRMFMCLLDDTRLPWVCSLLDP